MTPELTAKLMTLICEHPGCSNVGTDYRRLITDLEEDDEPEWLEEPIALCSQHAGNRTPVPDPNQPTDPLNRKP